MSAPRGIVEEIATEDLYRHNAFRVTGVPTDAGDRELRARAQRVAMARKLGQDAGASGPLPLDPAPTPEDVHEAEQRITDVERRFVDEFFWFWRLPGGARDVPYETLTRGDVQSAERSWDEAASRGADGEATAAALHNLAVLRHLRALDLERKAQEADPAAKAGRARKGAWDAAHAAWERAIAHDGVWAWMRSRTRALADPRVGEDAVRRLKEDATRTWARICARLARKAAERGDAATAREHVARMGHDTEPLRAEIAPLRSRIEVASAEAVAKAEADPPRGGAIGRALLESCTRDLEILDALFGDGNPLRVESHDRVAQAALSCQIDYSNKEKDWASAIEMVVRLRTVAEGSDARARLERSMAIAEENHRGNQCGFCRRQGVDEASAKSVAMYQITSRVGNTVRYNTLKVPVPRCRSCRGTHRALGTTAFLLAVLAVVVLWIREAGRQGRHGPGFWGTVGVFFVAWLVGWILFVWIGSRICGSRPPSSASGHESVKKLRSEGWVVGEKPTA